VSFPRGFPPIGLYQLEIYQWGTFDPAPDDVLVVRGPLFGGPSWDPKGNRGDVLFRRTLVPASGSAEQSSPNFRNTDRQPYRRAYLAEFGGVPLQQVDRLFCPTTIIRSQSGRDFLREAQSALTSQRKALVEFVTQAVKRSGGDNISGLRLIIEPVVKDKRSPASSPLPEIGPIEVSLK
jgi:hypothetical protein